MEFWGAEVKSGEQLSVVPGEGMILHISQACLGEPKKEKANESVSLYVKVDGKKLVLGTLFTDKLPQQLYDLVFDRDFELSHNWKSGSVHFCGYKANNPIEAYDSLSDDSDDSESEDIPLSVANNGKSAVPVKKEEPAGPQKSKAVKDKASVEGKQKVKIVEPKKEDKAEDDDENSDDDLMSEDEDESLGEDESDHSDEESDESDDEIPKKVEPSKKRAVDSATKSPAAGKKAKATPQKTDNKQDGGHVATPHPAKQGGKTPANKQTPKSAHSCKSCNRTFNSANALESHNKAKHSSGK